MKNRIIVFFVISFLLLSIFNTKFTNADAWDPKKIATSDNEIYVLGQNSRMVTIFNTKLQKTSQFEIVTPISSSLPMPSDICFDNGYLYVAEKTMRKILIYSPKGEFIRYLGGCGEILRTPSAVFVKNNRVYIGDLGCLYICTENGILLERIVLSPESGGALPIISDICEDNGTIFIANQTFGTIEVLGKNIKTGGLGPETGRFQKISGITSRGNLLIADPYLGKVEMKHPTIGDFVSLPLGEKNKHPSDLAWFNNQFICVDATNPEITKISVPSQKTKDPLLVSVTSLDFGSYPSNATWDHSFSVDSRDGFPLTGSAVSDNPLFVVTPTTWSGALKDFKVHINPRLIKDNSSEKGIITVQLNTGEKVTVAVKVQFGKSQDFFLAFGGNNQITFQNNQITIHLTPQNGLKGKIECSSKTPDLPFLVEWYPPSFEIDSDDPYKIQITLKPINKPSPGFYSIPYQIKAISQKMIKQGTFTFLYKGIENTVSGSILGELFTTDWCPFCPSAHRAMPELAKMYGAKFPILTYYIDCSDASPERLCFAEGTERKNWYLPQGTPTLILNGTTIKNGGYRSPTETMTKDYKEMIDQILPHMSPLSLDGFARFDSETRLFSVGTQIRWLQKRNLVDPRLYIAICENKIEYVAKNKETNHEFVVRQFLSLPNPEEHAAYGTQLLAETSSLFVEEVLDPVINPANMYCVIFVQDNATKQVVESRIVPINQLLSSDFTFYPIQSGLFYKKNQPFSARYILTNQGNQLENFTISISENAQLPSDTFFVVNGNEFSPNQTVSLPLCPNESTQIEIRSANSLDEEKVKSITLLASNRSQTVTKSATLLISFVSENQPRYEIIYPKGGLEHVGSSPWMLLRTEPGTTTNHQGWEVSADGILAIPLSNCPGDNSIEFDLIYPDKTREHVAKIYQSNLLMILTLGSTTVKTNDLIQTIEAPPYIKNGRTMVPVRIIAEAFCCQVEFDPASRGITIKSRLEVIALQIGNTKAMVNGKEVKLDAPPEIKNGRTFLPLRFITETFGAKIDWNAKLGEIQIRM